MLWIRFRKNRKLPDRIHTYNVCYKGEFILKKQIINANGTEISVIGSINDEEAYISLTDIAKYKNIDDPRIVISNWMSSYSTIDFLAMWEELYNPDFNRMEFHTVRNESGRLVMTPTRWIESFTTITRKLEKLLKRSVGAGILQVKV